MVRRRERLSQDPTAAVPGPVFALLALLCWAAPQGAAAQPDRIRTVLKQVDAGRIQADVAALSALRTRFALSTEFSQATDLLVSRLTQAGLSPVRDPLLAGAALVENVVVVLPGSVPGLPALIVGAHYDSINLASPGAAAPGAEDNGSGVAALLELARVLAGQKLATEVRLVFFAAEEEGVWGSTHMVAGLRQGNALKSVLAMLNMDMVGYDPAGKRHLLLDGFPVSRSLAGRVHAAAVAYTPLQISASITSEGRSDHRPFAEAGIPALTLATVSWRDYPYYHSDQDLPRYVDPEMVAGAARANLAALLRLAGFADGPPVARGGDFKLAHLGETITLSATDSFDPAGQPLTYGWAQLDGPRVAVPDGPGVLTFTPAEPGVYRFQVTAVSADGRVGEPDLAVAIVDGEEGCAAGGGGTGATVLFLIVLYLAVSCLVVLRRRRRRTPRAWRAPRRRGAPDAAPG